MILSQPAVEVNFVDADDRGKPTCSFEPQRKKRPNAMLGFNDHGGGSESRHRIMLNRFSGRDRRGQYVLYSPPDREGRPTSTTFFRGDFVFLEWEPVTTRGRFETSVPNPLKTAGAASGAGRDMDYNYYLVGNRVHRSSLVQAFRAAGFTFVPRPMTFEAHDRIRNLAVYQSNKPSDYKHYRSWPNGEPGAVTPTGQFAEQIARLRIAEASL